MFADDLLTAAQDADELQCAMTALSIWCEESGMTVNTSKTPRKKGLEIKKSRSNGEQKAVHKQDADRICTEIQIPRNHRTTSHERVQPNKLWFSAKNGI